MEKKESQWACRIGAVLLFGVLAGCSLVLYVVGLAVLPASTVDEPVEFSVPLGWSAGEVAAALQREGLVRSAWLFART